MIGLLSKASKFVPILKFFGAVSVLATAAYFVYDYFDTKANYDRVTGEMETLEDDVRRLERDLMRNKLNFETLKLDNEAINVDYRDSLRALDDIESQLEALSRIDPNKPVINPESDQSGHVKPPTVESTERDINALMQRLSTNIECYTGDKTKC